MIKIKNIFQLIILIYFLLLVLATVSQTFLLAELLDLFAT